MAIKISPTTQHTEYARRAKGCFTCVHRKPSWIADYDFQYTCGILPGPVSARTKRGSDFCQDYVQDETWQSSETLV